MQIFNRMPLWCVLSSWGSGYTRPAHFETGCYNGRQDPANRYKRQRHCGRNDQFCNDIASSQRWGCSKERTPPSRKGTRQSNWDSDAEGKDGGTWSTTCVARFKASAGALYSNSAAVSVTTLSVTTPTRAWVRGTPWLAPWRTVWYDDDWHHTIQVWQGQAGCALAHSVWCWSRSLVRP